MHTVVRTFSVAVVALVLAGLLSPAQVSAEAGGRSTGSGAVTSSAQWRLLHQNGAFYDGDGTFRSLLRTAGDDGRFSRDGTRFAETDFTCIDRQCTDITGTVRVHRRDGSSSVLAGVPDLDPRSLAWSPDGSQVAVVGEVVTPEDSDVRIYLFPTDGSPATMVYSDTQRLAIFPYGGLSWHPRDDRLAFIAAEFEQQEPDGPYFSVAGGSDQVWTVAASPSATPSRYTAVPDCSDDCSDFPGYRQPTWSPDGDLAVVQIDVFGEFGGPEALFLGYLEQGAGSAAKLAEATPIPTAPMAFSYDGQHLAYAIEDVSRDNYDDTRVVSAVSGTAVATITAAAVPFVDWQPCPSGTCATWGEVPTRVSVAGVARRSQVVVSGQVDPAPARATSVTISLDKKASSSAPWKKAAKVDVPVRSGKFTRSFRRPAGVQCRAKVTYFVVSLVSPDGSVGYPRKTVVFAC